MRVIILVSAICMLFVWSHGAPASSKGVGAYAYQDSSGNRYGGTYDLEDGKVVNVKGTPPGAVPGNLAQGKIAPGSLVPGDLATGHFTPVNFAPFQFAFPDIFPDEFRDLQNLLQEDFRQGFGDQDFGLGTSELDRGIASETGDNTDISGYTGFGGYGPGFGYGTMPGFGNFQGFGMPGMGMPGFNSRMGMPGMNMGQNSAFAAAAAGPGYVRHHDIISPPNPNMPNVNVVKYTEPNPSRSGDFYSVSSQSYSSSSNVNGQQVSSRGSETVVNNNGEVTKYKVHN